MKYHIICYGCQFNKADADKISQLLQDKGYKQSPTPEGADLVVILMCSVRQKSVERIKGQILKLKKISKKAKVILSGCVLESDKSIFKKMGVEIKDFKGLEKIKPTKGFVPIINGCNNFCSYCVVPYTRGREKSRPVKTIINEVKYLVKQAVKEITLVGQNVNSYKDNKTDFAELLRMVNDLEGDFKIKFLTSHPKDMTDKLIKAIAQCDKVEKYIHLPVQSGDNDILKKMNRHYTSQQYLALVNKIKKEIPNVKITTDIIVGFPGETKKAFQNTFNLCKKVGFFKAYIAKYSPREGTAAFKMNDTVPMEEKKCREKILLNLCRPERSEGSQLRDSSLRSE